MCKELFRGELKVTVKLDYSQRSTARRQKHCMYGTLKWFKRWMNFEGSKKRIPDN